jgi:hypothetical protein
MPQTMARRSDFRASDATGSCITWPVPQTGQIHIARAIPSPSGVPAITFVSPQI